MRSNRQFAGRALQGDCSSTEEGWQRCHCLLCLPWVEPWGLGMLDLSHHLVPIGWQKPACWGWQRARSEDSTLNSFLRKWQVFLWLESLLFGCKETQLRVWPLEPAVWRHTSGMSLTSSVPAFPTWRGEKSPHGVVKNKWVSVGGLPIKVPGKLCSAYNCWSLWFFGYQHPSISNWIRHFIKSKILRCCETLRGNNTFKNLSRPPQYKQTLHSFE